MDELKELIKHKVNADITQSIDTDKEFYYTVGQIISFMTERYTEVNKSFKKDLIARPVLLSKNVEDLKKKLRTLYKKTNGTLYMEDKKFNNAYAMVIGYAPNSSIDSNTMELGYVENCLLL